MNRTPDAGQAEYASPVSKRKPSHKHRFCRACVFANSAIGGSHSTYERWRLFIAFAVLQRSHAPTSNCTCMLH